MATKRESERAREIKREIKRKLRNRKLRSEVEPLLEINYLLSKTCTSYQLI